MISYNGNLTPQSDISIHQNRAFLYGDAIFETLKVLDGKVLFIEDHYFRLMASMRIIRMEIPMYFTMEYMEEKVLELVNNLQLSASARARLTFFRKPGGYYLPTDNNTEFIITADKMENSIYQFSDAVYEVDLFKDFYVTKQLLSSLKTVNKMVHITGSVYAYENGLNNCLLLNDDKNVVEALQGNLFMLMGNKLITPPVADGCLNGIMRKQVLAAAKKHKDIIVEEASISPFDLQKADELFITNVIAGIQPITKYRKKEYGNDLASDLLKKLNAQIRLGLV
ncbi:aminotransferase class IV [Flavobacterium salilacus subsp. salilacus]|uniref:aminotransferase class IV n=1 Tax=Flavobacterium TaxID=237 RepID=UPI001074DC17|nr:MULTISPECIES: aminotransferase class IV [Flavobacterium]KAF2519352.1 aminotransferase class IV [Flavobacterium salilacus subsp. salilacus]MBE1614757.1 aminotransferase class IV [Flavobacterium sp. SaA2.13]